MINIRQATLEDIPAMAQLYEAVLKRPANEAYLHTSIENYPVFVAFEDSQMVGLVYCRRFSPDILEIANILLEARYRNQGIGQELLHRVESAADQYAAIILVNSTLHTEAADKRAATNFYLKCGFSPILETADSKVFGKRLR